MIVKFNPPDEEKGSGTTCSAEWSNPDLQKKIHEVFQIRDNEQIESLEITPHGITARLKIITPESSYVRVY